MTAKPERLHIQLSGATRRELGLARGEALRSTLAASYAKYAELFRVLGVTEALEREGVERTLAALKGWRPEVIAEFEGIAEAAGVDFAQVVALNARTEILALAPRASSECSTATAQIDGRRFGVQTWDWHIELDGCWHTHEVAGPGHRYAGLTEEASSARSESTRPASRCTSTCSSTSRTARTACPCTCCRASYSPSAPPSMRP